MVEVVEVVAGDELRETLDAFLAAFAVNAELFALLGLQGFEEFEISFALDAKAFEGFAGISFGVLAVGGPGVLVEGLNGNAGRRKNGAEAPAGDDFGVGKMRENFDHGPFVGSGTLSEFCGRGAPQQRGEIFCSCGLNAKRILTIEFALNALDVFLDGFLHGEKLLVGGWVRNAVRMDAG